MTWIGVGVRWAGLVGAGVRAWIWIRWAETRGKDHRSRRRRKGRRRLAGVTEAFVGLLKAMVEKPKSQYKSKNHQHCHYEDEDLCSFTHITHFFFFFLSVSGVCFKDLSLGILNLRGFFLVL